MFDFVEDPPSEKMKEAFATLCEMVLDLDVVICPEEIREDGMAILKETEFTELFDFVHRDILGIVG